MRLHLLEHDPFDLSRSNITIWAEKKRYQIARTYLCNDEKLPDIKDFDWLIISGGSPHAWEEEVHPWLTAEKEFIARALDHNKIMLGICFGAQLLAEALGGKVFPNEYREIGWHEVTVTPAGRKSFLFRKIPAQFLTFHWHADHFSLPAGCTRLAYSKPTANQAYICEGRPLAGLQFHPEYTLEIVKYFARKWGHEWEAAAFVTGPKVVLAQSQHLPETYGLMATLLDNLDQQFVRG